MLANKVKRELEGAADRRLPFGQDQRRDDQRSARAAVQRAAANFLTLTATTEREQSFEDPNLSTGFGFFTYFLVQACAATPTTIRATGGSRPTSWSSTCASNVRRYARDRSCVANADGPRRLRAGDAAGRRQRLSGDGRQGAVDARHGHHRDRTWTMWTLYIDGNADRPAVEGQAAGRAEPARAGCTNSRACKTGYEPDRKEVMIAPGQEVDGHAAHPIRPSDQEGGARAERRRARSCCSRAARR